MPNIPKPSVVRCLFPEPASDRQAHCDNSMNTSKDIIAADVERMRVKWNYDAENDRPLDGAVRWEKSEDTRYHYIGVISNGLDEDACEKEDRCNQVEEARPRCKTKEMEEIANATGEGPKKS